MNMLNSYFIVVVYCKLNTLQLHTNTTLCRCEFSHNCQLVVTIYVFPLCPKLQRKSKSLLLMEGWKAISTWRYITSCKLVALELHSSCSCIVIIELHELPTWWWYLSNYLPVDSPEPSFGRIPKTTIKSWSCLIIKLCDHTFKHWKNLPKIAKSWASQRQSDSQHEHYLVASICFTQHCSHLVLWALQQPNFLTCNIIIPVPRIC